MTFELLGASVAAVTTATTPMPAAGPFPIVVHTGAGEAVPSRVRTTRWHAATRCFGASGFMLKVGKKLQAESPSTPSNWEGRIFSAGAGVAPGVGLVTLFQTFFPYIVK